MWSFIEFLYEVATVQKHAESLKTDENFFSGGLIWSFLDQKGAKYSFLSLK